MCSYLFIGMAYGILMEEAGFTWIHTLFACLTLYTGAFQFVLTTLLASGASLLTILVTAFLMSSRQTFYSISYVDEFNRMGRWKPFMIFSLTDETYVVNFRVELTGEERKKALRWIALLSYIYWAAGSVAGCVAGQLIPVDMDGIDFCMTALFVTTFVDQWEKTDIHLPAIAGIVIAVACLCVFGESRLMLPSLLLVSGVLVLYNSRTAGKEGPG